jgi:Thioesterase-like superfamily
MSGAVFSLDDVLFMPGTASTGPWGNDRLHGGPVFGLLARAVEIASPDPELVVTRLSFDLFRPVPVAPLAVRIEPLRQGSRLVLLQAMLLVDEVEFARATALLLRPSDGLPEEPAGKRPEGPEGLPTETLMRQQASQTPAGLPPGFHTRVETRWVPRREGEPLSVWFRLPIPLIEGEAPTPLQAAVALSDFTNAVASIAGRERNSRATPFINADATIYLARRPEGEWFCLTDARNDSERGISVAECTLSDTRGIFGRAVQARIANRMQR